MKKVTFAAVLLSAAIPAFATNDTWTGGGTTNNISEGANWLSGAAQVVGGTFTFSGSSKLNVTNDLGLSTSTDTGITFDNTAGAFVITGTALRGGTVTNNSSNLQTLGISLRLNGGRTINTGSAGIQLNVSPLSTGTSGRTITKTGSGNLTLNYTGSISNMAYSASAGNIVVANSTGTLTFSTNSTVTVGSGTNLILAQAGTANFANGVTGAGSVLKTGTGSSTLSGTVNYTGGTGVDKGTLTFGSAFTMAGANSFGGLTGATTAGTDYGQITSSSAFTYGGNLTFNFSSATSAGASYDFFNVGTSTGAFSSVSIGGSYASASFAETSIGSKIWELSTGGLKFTFTADGGINDGILAVSAIPEPSSAAALAGVLGLGAAALRRRRRA